MKSSLINACSAYSQFLNRIFWSKMIPKRVLWNTLLVYTSNNLLISQFKLFFFQFIQIYSLQGMKAHNSTQNNFIL